MLNETTSKTNNKINKFDIDFALKNYINNLQYVNYTYKHKISGRC